MCPGLYIIVSIKKRDIMEIIPRSIVLHILPLIMILFSAVLVYAQSTPSMNFKCEQDGYFERIVGNDRKAVVCTNGTPVTIFEEQVPAAATQSEYEEAVKIAAEEGGVCLFTKVKDKKTENGNFKVDCTKGQLAKYFFNDQQLSYRDWLMKAMMISSMVSGLTKDSVPNPPGADCSSTDYTLSVVADEIHYKGTGGCITTY